MVEVGYKFKISEMFSPMLLTSYGPIQGNLEVTYLIWAYEFGRNPK